MRSRRTTCCSRLTRASTGASISSRDEKVRVRSIVTVPSDTSCRFILFGTYGRSFSSVAVHVDFRRSRVHNVRVCPFSPVTPADAVVYR
jgi:hypothetical protein